jgi:hypothetical protein
MGEMRLPFIDIELLYKGALTVDLTVLPCDDIQNRKKDVYVIIIVRDKRQSNRWWMVVCKFGNNQWLILIYFLMSSYKMWYWA